MTETQVLQAHYDNVLSTIDRIEADIRKAFGRTDAMEVSDND